MDYEDGDNMGYEVRDNMGYKVIVHGTSTNTITTPTATIETIVLSTFVSRVTTELFGTLMDPTSDVFVVRKETETVGMVITITKAPDTGKIMEFWDLPPTYTRDDIIQNNEGTLPLGWLFHEHIFLPYWNPDPLIDAIRVHSRYALHDDT